MPDTTQNIDYSKTIPAADLASFQKANPDLTFGKEDLARYNAAIDPNIKAGDVGNVNAFNVPVQPTTNLDSLVSSFQKQAETSTQKEDTAMSDLISSMTTLEGEGADQIKSENEAGLMTLNKELRSLENVARQQTAEYLANIVKSEGKRDTRNEATVAQNHLNRQRAIDVMLSNSLIAAKQGDITFAQNVADRAVKLKYEPIKARLETQKVILQQASGKAAQDRLNQVNAQLKLADANQKKEEDLAKLIVDAANQGAPADLIKKAQETGDIVAASSILGRYSSDYLDRQYKQAQIANIYSEISKRNAEAIEANNKKNFVTPPIINPQTGAVDPLASLTSVIDSTGAKTNVKLNAIASVLSATQALAQKNTEGKFKGLAVLPRLTPGFLKSQEQVSNKADIEAINLNVQNWASGAALTDAQTKQVNKITPKKGDSDNEVRKKLNALSNYMLTQAAGELASQGINYTPGTVNYFGGGLSELSNQKLLETLPSTGGITNNKSFFDQY